MRKIKNLLIVFLAVFGLPAFGQVTFPRNDVMDKRMEAYALTNATIVTDGITTEKGTLLIKDGTIEGVGASLAIPKGYITIDLKGKYIYPSLIDIYTNYGLPEIKRESGGGGGFGGREQIESKTKGAYNANEGIKSHFNASEEFAGDEKKGEELRKLGFGAVLAFRPDGFARGTSVFVTLSGKNNEDLIKKEVAAHYSFDRGTSTQQYPRSMMGYIALLRQTFLDAQWYGKQNPKPFNDQSLDAWIRTQSLPQVFETSGWMNILRADKLGDEFGVQYIIKEGGDAYKRIAEIKATKANLIVPVSFPEAHDVEDPIDAEVVSYGDMLHWELAPSNAGVLETNGINFALTTAGLKNTSDFLGNVRKAIKYGLSEDMALKALTTIPATMMGVSDRVGSLKKGMLANFIITTGKLFDEKTNIHENWVQGKPFRYKALETTDKAGEYTLSVGANTYRLEVSGTPDKPETKIIVDDTTKLDVKSTISKDLISLSFKPEKKAKNAIRLSGWAEGNGWKGRGQLEDGTWIDWSAVSSKSLEAKSDKKKTDKENEPLELGKVIFPFSAYGMTELPKQEDLLIRNATVWTNENEGILQNTDVLLKSGKIAQVGKNLPAGTAKVVDGTGKHLTAGIIDEHSHIAASSINDVAVNSSMVRIGDNIDPEDIDIYRALAGGVVAVQVLHGSANPIGGQSALVKMRWGVSPEAMKIEGAEGFIKFALGENVKRTSNATSIRFPQTRMGVEQVYVDAFTNAREYEKDRETWNALTAAEKLKKSEPRKDLVQEAMVEILNKKRFITCHSYVQSEINMMMEVAEQFGFRINTFTHILEGYKVADKMKEHGVGGSSFSDWWNYKWEVRYAIPYNAAIMHKAGVLTAINSDDNNIGRRLNQEAAKTIKYGDVSEEDALKFVTLNPAKMLHLENKMGSIKVGKDADVVLWTDHPLSVYAKPEKTIVDGKVYFDIAEDQQRRLVLQKDRARLIQKMVGEKKAGAPTKKEGSPVKANFHCEDVLGEESHSEH